MPALHQKQSLGRAAGAETQVIVAGITPLAADFTLGFRTFFMTPIALRIKEFIAHWTTNSTSLNVNLERRRGSQSSGTGIIYVPAVNTSTGAGTMVVNTFGTAREGTAENLFRLERGDRLGLFFTGTLGGLANFCVSVVLIPLRPTLYSFAT